MALFLYSIWILVFNTAFAAWNSMTNSRDKSRERWRCLLMAMALSLATLAAYSNSFSGPFNFDDIGAIAENATIRNLAELKQVFSPPTGGVTVSGRPLLNFTFAVNYAISGLNVWSYHAFNLMIHILAGLTLMGVVRRTLLRPSLRERFGKDAQILAFTIALLWILHPLASAAVSYIVQRAESLVSLFYLSTLYCFIRSLDAPDEKKRQCRLWRALSVAACLMGVLSKEVIVTAPVVILIYDRAFGAGRFGAAFRQKAGYYACLFGCWALLGLLMAGTGGRGNTAGFSTPVSVIDYIHSQCWAVIQYLRLAFWPSPLIFDYGQDAVFPLKAVFLRGAILTALLGAAFYAFARNWAAGFCAVVYFIILAPTSSFIPVADPIFEHRAYLATSAAITLIAMTAYAKAGRNALIPLLIVALSLGILTHHRNRAYRSELALWADTAKKRPGSSRALCHLGLALFDLNRVDETIEIYEKAQKIAELSPLSHLNLGSAYAEKGWLPRAIGHFKAALAAKPGFVEAEYNLGRALTACGRYEQAVTHLEAAAKGMADRASVETDLGAVLFNLGRIDEASEHFERALKIQPDYFEAEFDLGMIAFRRGRLQAARERFEAVLRIHPDHGGARANLNAVTERMKRGASSTRSNPRQKSLMQVKEKGRRISPALNHHSTRSILLDCEARHFDRHDIK